MEPAKPHRIRAWYAIGALWLLLVNQSVAAAPASRPAAKIHVTITKDEYAHGFMTVTGIAKNIGTGDAFSPTIIIEVYDRTETTLLAQDHSWPAGQYLSTMRPGVSAAFRSITSVPGEPSRVIYKVRVDKYPFEVIWRKTR